MKSEIKVSFMWTLVCLVGFSFPSQAMKGFSENGDVLDLSNICIISQKGAMSSSPGGWQKPGLSVEEVIDEFIEPNKNQLSTVQILDLSSNNLTDDSLASFVMSLKIRSLWELLKDVQLVCLENNNFTHEVSFTLKELLELYNKNDEREDKVFPYISIVNTPVALSKVNKLARKLKGAPSQPHPLMEHLIFMREYYIWHAENRVRTYHNMVKARELPQNWVSIQRGYYKSSSYKGLISYRNQQKDKSWMSFVKSSLSQPLPSAQEESDITALEVEKLAKVVGALSLKASSLLSSTDIE
ncbi:MAG: hypothetical protein K2P93_09060 [Alphaproteobacteria bacterium]|nr:hypothetical protein [Alphaproteobacteria bacterium]